LRAAAEREIVIRTWVMSDVLIEEVEWLEPWSPVAGDTHASRLQGELQKEVGPGHILFGRKAQAIAVRSDQDDVLFVVRAPAELAVVHLTWSSGVDRLLLPKTTLFQTVAEFVAERMDPDHSDFTVAG
jgi:hypothetical protein